MSDQTLREQIEQMIAKWRAKLPELARDGLNLKRREGSTALGRVAEAYQECADELSALLSAVQQAADRLASLEQAQQALRGYTTHKTECGVHRCRTCGHYWAYAHDEDVQHVRDVCTCGLDALTENAGHNQ